ncbi:hypothetical protein GXM_06788 [Nostoc sphaeroides CCNUC1]|uniref:Uncharacterized protein n=1 Tax=Nostoc sphaeroides CCNUC1 TaxID=2653204 RepID=A0A5P8W9F9_9NOSO|nr:hypothetical protein GXM_06788 [Nostoc sphaeroides CCNUC1]
MTEKRKSWVCIATKTRVFINFIYRFYSKDFESLPPLILIIIIKNEEKIQFCRRSPILNRKVSRKISYWRRYSEAVTRGKMRYPKSGSQG